MKKPSFSLFKTAIAIYVAIAIIFIVRVFLSVVPTPTLTNQSAIPELAINTLESLASELSGRTSIPQVQPIDLSEFDFGNIEPFN
jgi:hypothetical protein